MYIDGCFVNMAAQTLRSGAGSAMVDSVHISQCSFGGTVLLSVALNNTERSLRAASALGLKGCPDGEHSRDDKSVLFEAAKDKALGISNSQQTNSRTHNGAIDFVTRFAIKYILQTRVKIRISFIVADTK